ncbi:hypothetical protein GE061_014118 [Apolygus lucorum]|uniref:Uncharacterized protein n=1 Tax=Apolygus lucorum TaxID=248454 RepID=A0A8S9XTT1_APOLU|nr:hypothetical protein GE061_014118 [Apolygus lucorum]
MSELSYMDVSGRRVLNESASFSAVERRITLETAGARSRADVRSGDHTFVTENGGLFAVKHTVNNDTKRGRKGGLTTRNAEDSKTLDTKSPERGHEPH